MDVRLDYTRRGKLHKMENVQFPQLLSMWQESGEMQEAASSSETIARNSRRQGPGVIVLEQRFGFAGGNGFGE